MADDDLSTRWEETEGQTAKDAASATDQHFWADTDGAHVSSTGDHDLSGLNLLLTSAKLAFRKVLAELLTIDAVNGVISFLGGLVTIRGVEWHRGGTDYEGVGMHSTDGTEITCDSSWDGEPARVAVGRTGPAGETGGCVYLEGQRIFAKDPSLVADGANASMAALWALLVGANTHVVAGESAVTLADRFATVLAAGPTQLTEGAIDGVVFACTAGVATLSVWKDINLDGPWASVTIGTVPAGYRPANQVYQPTVCTERPDVSTVLRVRPTGEVQVAALGGNVPGDHHHGATLSWAYGL